MKWTLRAQGRQVVSGGGGYGAIPLKFFEDSEKGRYEPRGDAGFSPTLCVILCTTSGENNTGSAGHVRSRSYDVSKGTAFRQICDK